MPVPASFARALTRLPAMVAGQGRQLGQAGLSTFRQQIRATPGENTGAAYLRYAAGLQPGQSLSQQPVTAATRLLLSPNLPGLHRAPGELVGARHFDRTRQAAGQAIRYGGLASTLAAVPASAQAIASLPQRLATEIGQRVELPVDKTYANTLRPTRLQDMVSRWRYRVAGIDHNTSPSRWLPVATKAEHDGRHVANRVARTVGLPPAYLENPNLPAEPASDGGYGVAVNYPRERAAFAARKTFLSQQLLPTLWNAMAQPIGFGRETSPAAAKLSRQLLLDMAAGDVKSYRAANPALTTAADTVRSLGSPVGAGITWLLRQNDAYQRPSPIERYREYRPQLAADARRGLVKPSPTLRNFWQLLKQPYFLAAE